MVAANLLCSWLAAMVGVANQGLGSLMRVLLYCKQSEYCPFWRYLDLNIGLFGVGRQEPIRYDFKMARRVGFF